ncbi:Scr1 family TA system antitoxin-like transcriptional regulator [Nocardiopsis sediminis]|uniref:Scr1 family TA system antitoxin-like transcriptional regulator n=1 Tax=Nocardiopsis sediminis TaxID=1778267 RepID=A0ABV8FUJ9_9ACTN
MGRSAKQHQKRIGREIRAARDRMGLTQSQVADALSVVQSAVSAWESGVNGVSAEQAAQLDKLLGTSGVIQRAWNKANTTDALPEWYERVEELERNISELREYQSSVIPGLIQTEGYIRGLLRDSAPWASKQEVERMVKSRLNRQRILDRDEPPSISMVIEESVLKRHVGASDDPGTLSVQLARVLDLIDRGVLRMQVMPADAECHPGASGPFRIYTFPDEPVVASAEHMWGEQVSDKRTHVQQCTAVFGILQSEARSPRASRDLIRKVKDELDEKPYS